jgi:uncharacterized Zn-binding protein involved in type VI secretion
MPGRPAARILDLVAHPLPGMLTPGPGSFNTIIGGKLAWRGIGGAGAAAIQAAKTVSDTAIKAAEAATLAAAGTPGLPAAKAAEETVKATAATTMGSMITSAAGGADIHACLTPLPIPPHGPGVVVDGSQTVLINNLPACRQGDTVIEAVGPPDKIVLGEQTVLIGDAMSMALDMIKASDFGKTPEGKKVIAKLEALDAAGQIQFGGDPANRGEWNAATGIKVNPSYATDPNQVASELMHEGTHGLNEDEFPASKSKATIDEELRTNTNQLDLYEEQRRSGFRDPDLEQRRTDRANGKLRDNVRRRYPGTPEHL